MDELIIRSLQGKTNPLEEGQLAAWRRASLAHERRYRDALRVWRATGMAAPASGAPPGEVIGPDAGALLRPSSVVRRAEIRLVERNDGVARVRAGERGPETPGLLPELGEE